MSYVISIPLVVGIWLIVYYLEKIYKDKNKK